MIKFLILRLDLYLFLILAKEYAQIFEDVKMIMQNILYCKYQLTTLMIAIGDYREMADKAAKLAR